MTVRRSRQKTKDRAVGAGVFIGAVVLGGSLTARATAPCYNATIVPLSVESVTVDGAPRPQPTGRQSFAIIKGWGGGVNARLYDPDGGPDREVGLEEAP